jgi:hypothetical protein
MIRVANEDGAMNLGDLLTMSLPGPQLSDLIELILY